METSESCQLWKVVHNRLMWDRGESHNRLLKFSSKVCPSTFRRILCLIKGKVLCIRKLKENKPVLLIETWAISTCVSTFCI